MMCVFIIAAMSADGFVARAANELVDWSSKEDKKLFVQLTKEAGTMVMGGNTFRTIGKALPGRRNIVYSRQSIEEPGVEVTQEAPAALVARLEREGVQSLAVCGGASVYDMFLQAGLVDELYLTIEPRLFGAGMSLAASPLDIRLALKESRALNQDTLLVHYEVIR